MELEKQVCSLELAKKLKNLGVKQGNSVFWWCGTEGCPETIVQSDSERYCESCGMAGDNYDAFTVAELGEILPKGTHSRHGKHGWSAVWSESEGGVKNMGIRAETEANARAKMLIYLLENNSIPVGR